MSAEVPWIPTPSFVVEYILDQLGVDSKDVVVDLGCGDGRIVVAAAQRGAYTYCIELDRVLCNVTEIHAALRGVKDRVTVICRSFYEVDLSTLRPRPTIVYAYLYPSTLEALAPKLEKELEPGTIVVSLDFAIRGWSPFFAKTLVDEYGHTRIIWLYVIGLSNPSARYVGISREYRSIASKLLRRRFALV